ncbi:MAG: sodium:proton antiporter, partial [candidate division Zixibacteria bacterium]|nr:sodium:proton antiporter [candidate division Zixibacteria bacterium]
MEAVPIISGAPFVILLLLIAVLPLSAPRYWDSNRNKAIITAIVSLPILIFLLIDFRGELVHSLKDYVSFIILLASLYIISGGILMTGDLKATPATNSMFLVVGAIIANLIGNTGASMV